MTIFAPLKRVCVANTGKTLREQMKEVVNLHIFMNADMWSK